MPRRDPEARKLADRVRNKTDARRAADRARKRRKRWQEGNTFRCGQCTGRYSKLRESWRMKDGRRVRVGLCAFCAFCAELLRRAS